MAQAASQVSPHSRTLSDSPRRRQHSTSSQDSSSSQITTVSAIKIPVYPSQQPRAAASTTSLTTSQRSVSRSASDLPFRQANTPSIAASQNPRLRQHSQGLFDPSLPSHGNLSASAIAAQAAMHVQNQQHSRKRSQQHTPDPLPLNKTQGHRKPPFPPPIHTNSATTTSSSSSSQSRNNSIVDSRAAANAAFPRSPSRSPSLTHATRTESPAPVSEKDQKPPKKESRMKLFSKPRHMHISRDKEGDKKALPSPKSLYNFNSGSKFNQSTTSLVETSTSGAVSLYSSANASTSTLMPAEKPAPSDKEKPKTHFLSRHKNKHKDTIEHHEFTYSSASSNSRPVDVGAVQPLYSFAPSSPGTGLKSISGLDLRHGGRAIRGKRKEEKAAAASNFVPPVPTNSASYDAAMRSRQDSHADMSDPATSGTSVFGPASASTFASQVSAELGLPAPSLGAFGLQGMGADDAWPLLKARLLNIFEGEDLRTPIEDFNRLLLIHLRACIQRRAPNMILEDLRDLLQTGFRSLDQTLRSLTEEQLVSHLVEMWAFVFGTVLPFIQAVFLPLDLEFKGIGPLMSTKEATEFWALIAASQHRPSIATITPGNPSGFPKAYSLDVRAMTLQTFRDVIIIPRHDILLAIFSRLSLDSINAAAAHADLHNLSDRPSTASSSSVSAGFSSAMPGSFDPSSYNSQSSTLLDSNGTGSLGARSRATSNTSAGSFHSIGSTRPSAQRQQQNRAAQSTIQLRSPPQASSHPVDSARVTATAARMLQCVSVLASLRMGSGADMPSVPSHSANADDEDLEDPETAARRKMERLASELKLNWLGRARTGRNRRGLVGTKVRTGIGVAA